MKNLIFAIACLSLIIYSSIKPREVRREVRIIEKKVRIYESIEVRKMALIEQHIKIPLEKKFGRIYWTSTGRYDEGSQHHLLDTTSVGADLDQDVLIKRGCDTCATNKEIFDYCLTQEYDQIAAGWTTKRPSYVHIGKKLFEENRKEILVKRYGRYKKIN